MPADMAAGGGDVSRAGESVDADREVAQGCHGGGSGAGADLGVVFGVGTSRIQCSRFSMPQCPRRASASWSARMWP
jgi:hypothetical protein